jgi:citrate lyase subunit beta/citryl-CoA lyase
VPDLRLRSLLIAPANRPELTAKLPRSGPDGGMLDLEDAVPPAAKAQARVHARAVAADLVVTAPETHWFVRVNATGTPWFGADVSDALGPGLTGVVVPKLESGGQVGEVRKALAACDQGRLGIVAGLETAVGVEAAPEVLSAPGVIGAYFGAEDYIADVGGARTAEGDEVLYARSRVALAGRLAGVPVVDQIVADFRDRERFRADAARGRAIGYRGKLCIHPDQVPLAHEAFTPSDEEVDRARRLLAAYEAATGRGRAAIDFEGQMVDEPLARQARAVLAAARVQPPSDVA